MMQWVLLVTAACVTGVTLEQPNQCEEDSQCTKGHYCNTDMWQCKECMQCSSLGRTAPEIQTKCIKSVVECGPCLIGLVPDQLGVGCTEPVAPFEGPMEGWKTRDWVWAGSLVVAILAFSCAGLIYVLRNMDAIKFTTRTSVRAPVVCGAAAGGDGGHEPPPQFPSAPTLPPYLPPTIQVQPASPPPETYPYPYTEEPSAPLVKRRGSAGVMGGGGAAREAAGRQAARVYSNPEYVRNVPPPSYDSAFDSDSDHETPFVPHDEDTMESVWMPGPGTLPANGDVNGNTNSTATTLTVEQENASGPLVPTRRADRVDRADASPPPGKIRRLEDSNNNEGSGSSGNGHPPPASPPSPPSQPPPPPHAPPPAPSFVINVLNVNSVHQLNDVSL